MEFVKQYNAATEDKAGQVIPVEITIFEDRSLQLRAEDAADGGPPPPGSRAWTKGPRPPAARSSAPLTDAQLTEIAQIKMPDLNANDLEAAKAQVAGTARSMGVKVG